MGLSTLQHYKKYVGIVFANFRDIPVRQCCHSTRNIPSRETCEFSNVKNYEFFRKYAILKDHPPMFSIL